MSTKKDKRIGNQFWKNKDFELKLKIRREEPLSIEGKYPKEYRYLPMGIYDVPTHNSQLLSSDELEFHINRNTLQPSTKSLGINKNDRKLNKTINWGSFYVLHAVGTNLFKIGVSSNFKRRYRDICCASPLPVTIIERALCDNPNLLEDHFHRLFKEKHFKNEWFALNEEDLSIINNQLSKYYHAY